ncbi:DUF6349 family protein [Nonomuraea helvata]|uniref:DUF6349 family protein n=1 Tax=Nonomuraea helvata TaxID=37484 RepID=A0ABV5SIE8_9ACTN
MTQPAPDHEQHIRIAITHPDPPEGGDCRVTVRNITTRAQRGNAEGRLPTTDTDDGPRHGPRYRSYCGGCGEEGPLREDESLAVEDGCDHAYPGWRSMPVVVHRPYTDKPQPLARWKEQVRAVYPAGWLDRQGPVRELRHGLGSRHVPGLAPGGGYLMAVMRPDPKKSRSLPAIQTSLF